MKNRNSKAKTCGGVKNNTKKSRPSPTKKPLSGRDASCDQVEASKLSSDKIPKVGDTSKAKKEVRKNTPSATKKGKGVKAPKAKKVGSKSRAAPRSPKGKEPMPGEILEQGDVPAEGDRMADILENAARVNHDPLVVEQIQDDLDLELAKDDAKVMQEEQQMEEVAPDKNDPDLGPPDIHLGGDSDVPCSRNSFEVTVDERLQVTYSGTACFYCIKKGLVSQLPARTRSKVHGFSCIRRGFLGGVLMCGFTKCLGFVYDEDIPSFSISSMFAAAIAGYNYIMPSNISEMPDSGVLSQSREPGLLNTIRYYWNVYTRPAKMVVPAGCHCKGTYTGEISRLSPALVLKGVVQNWATSSEGVSASVAEERKECFAAKVYGKEKSTMIQSLRKSQVTQDTCDLAQNVPDSELRGVVARVATMSMYTKDVVTRSLCNYAKCDRSIGMAGEAMLSSLSAMPE